jgi:phosphoglycerol transferase MdoB-like AlkP superfamily enzyme
MKHPAGSGRAAASRFFILPAALGIPLIALVVTLIVEAFNHRVFTTGFASMLDFLETHPLAFAVDALLVMVTLAPAFFLRRRFFYVTLLSAVWLIAGGVNGFILMSRMTPFTTADLTVLNTGLDTLPNYMSTQYIILLAVLLSALLILLILLAIRGPRNAFSWRRRLLCGALATALSAGALAGSWLLAFQTEQLSTVFANLGFAYEDYGFPYCFLQTWLNVGIRKPRTYSASEMQRIRKEIDDDTKTTTELDNVNVLYVQLESFIDPAQIKGLELSQPAAPNWEALKGSFTSGYLTVPVVGAGTANTEFEVLTGMSVRYFGPGEYPYKTCLQDHTTESVAYDLKALGYAAHAVHNHRATFYTRDTVYANLGFDDFTSLEFMPRTAKTPKGWSKDAILTGQITAALDSTPNQPDLVFTVSVQGHGSYPTEKILQNPTVTVTACPDDCDADAVEYYVNQIHEMDEFIGNLTQELSARKERTILVLYGDHLPSLGLKREDMESGSLYKTEYLIWNNFGLRQRDENLTAYELSATALGSLGITQGYMNRFHQFCEGESTYRTDLKALQYDALYGGNLLYDGKSPFAHVDMKMGVQDITVTGLHQRNGVWYVEGDHFSPFCRITVDGHQQETLYVSPQLLELTKDPGTTDYCDLGVQVVDMHKEILRDVPAANGDTDSKGS